MKNYDYLIVGSGLFGATVARLLTDNGYKCLVVDKRKHIGGNCFSEKEIGIDIHKYGPHILHTNDVSVWDFIKQYTDITDIQYSPIANYRGEYYPLPFNMWLFNKLWGVKTPTEAKLKIKEVTNKIVGVNNLEDFAISVVGNEIYEKLIKGYTEKQWKLTAKELPIEIIKRLPIRFTYDKNYFNDKFQGLPSDGYGAFFEKLLSGIDVKLGVNYFDGDYSNDGFVNVIYTGRVDELYELKFGELKYLTLDFKTEFLDVDSFQGNPVINFTSKDVEYTRIIEHKHFLNKNGINGSIITYETPIQWVSTSTPYYPINTNENNLLYETYRKYHGEQNNNIILGGRLGDYKYYNMDQTILSAIKLIKKLI